MTTHAAERRAAVRIRPIDELPSRARLVEGERRIELRVLDVSVGGFAVAGDPELRAEEGRELRVELDLGRFGKFEVLGVIRHCAEEPSGAVGVQIVDPRREVTGALGRYIAELLERGASS